MEKKLKVKPDDDFINTVLSLKDDFKGHDESVLNNDDVEFTRIGYDDYQLSDSIIFDNEVFSDAEQLQKEDSNDIVIRRDIKGDVGSKYESIDSTYSDSSFIDRDTTTLLNNEEIASSFEGNQKYTELFEDDDIREITKEIEPPLKPRGNKKESIYAKNKSNQASSEIRACKYEESKQSMFNPVESFNREESLQLDEYIYAEKMSNSNGNNIKYISDSSEGDKNKQTDFNTFATNQYEEGNFIEPDVDYATITGRSTTEFVSANEVHNSDHANEKYNNSHNSINYARKSINTHLNSTTHYSMNGNGSTTLFDGLTVLDDTMDEDLPESDDSEATDLPTCVLQQIFKLRRFRTNQKEIVEASLANKDVFVLMPTGGGKSITFQLPALLCNGVTLVISPLLSLIQDQLQSLHSKNIVALAISSQLTVKEKNLIFEILQREPLLCKIFYVTPELLVKSEIFQKILVKINVSRIVIDEAHCVSQWGHDFRPDYKEIGNVLEHIYMKNRPPIIALTATASPKVECDVIANLKMKNVQIFRMSFNRANLIYYVHKKTKTIDVDIVSFITTYYPNSCGIIYCTSKKECEMMSETLNEKYNLKTRFYHAGLNKNERNDVQTRWNSGDFKVIVATIAFGMGIDKKDVRFVIHYSLPKSLEGYYQETGRAGRDSLESVCVLFYSYSDKRILEFMIDKGTNSFANKRRQKDELRNVIQFCENITDCRRQQVLLHFGENFDPKDCKNTCDNCMKVKGKSKSSDFSDHAKNIYSLVGSIREMTLNNIVDIYRGSANKKSSEHKNNFYYGKGMNLKRVVVERLVKALIGKGFLQERVKKNTMGFSWNYLVAGKKLTGKIELLMEEDEITKPQMVPNKNINYNLKPNISKSRRKVVIEDDIKLVDSKNTTKSRKLD